MVKRTDAATNWILHDSQRNDYNVADKRLFPNLSNAELTADSCDLLSNGFKLRETGTAMNTSGGTYIFMAFAEMPTKFCASMAR